jgi:outer membrane protein
MGKFIVTGAALILSIASICLHVFNRERILYVDTGKLVEGFTLAKELDKKMDEVLKAKKAITDSLFREYKKLSAEADADKRKDIERIKKLAGLEDEMNYKQQEFEKENKAMTADYMSQVWGKLNQYVMDYGKKNNCVYILGATGQGNLMFARDDRSITEELIQYVNERYEDKVK